MQRMFLCSFMDRVEVVALLACIVFLAYIEFLVCLVSLVFLDNLYSLYPFSFNPAFAVLTLLPLGIIQTSLTIVFLLVAQHNSSKLDSVFAPASVDCSRLIAKFSFLLSHFSFLLSFNSPYNSPASPLFPPWMLSGLCVCLLYLPAG